MTARQSHTHTHVPAIIGWHKLQTVFAACISRSAFLGIRNAEIIASHVRVRASPGRSSPAPGTGSHGASAGHLILALASQGKALSHLGVHVHQQRRRFHPIRHQLPWPDQRHELGWLLSLLHADRRGPRGED